MCMLFGLLTFTELVVIHNTVGVFLVVRLTRNEEQRGGRMFSVGTVCRKVCKTE